MTEQERFDATMKKILSVSKAELQRRLEEEKKAKNQAASACYSNPSSEDASRRRKLPPS